MFRNVHNALLTKQKSLNIAKHRLHVCLVVHDDLETAVSEVAAEGEDLAGEAVVDGVEAPADNI